MLLNRERNIGGAVSSSQFVLSPDQLMVRYNIRRRQVILYAGTFEPYQGLDLLVDAAPSIVQAKPSTLFLCLGGNETQTGMLQRRARSRNVENYFLFPGVVSRDDVEAHFGLARILVSLRVSGTNTPLKIYSYLRSGVPIVATNIRSHTQVLTPDVALLVEPSVDAIATGILQLLENEELARRLSQNAAKLAQEQFSVEAYNKKVAQVYAFLETRSMCRNT